MAYSVIVKYRRFDDHRLGKDEVYSFGDDIPPEELWAFVDELHAQMKLKCYRTVYARYELELGLFANKPQRNGRYYDVEYPAYVDVHEYKDGTRHFRESKRVEIKDVTSYRVASYHKERTLPVVEVGDVVRITYPTTGWSIGVVVAVLDDGKESGVIHIVRVINVGSSPLYTDWKSNEEGLLAIVGKMSDHEHKWKGG